MFKETYKPEEYNDVLKEGEYTATITSAHERLSKSNNNMVQIDIDVVGIKFFHYLVDNDYFNRNATKFFDTFHIQHGNFNYHQWIGKRGQVEIGKTTPNANGRVYMEIKRLIPPDGQLDAAQPQAPASQMKPDRFDKTIPSDAAFTDDIPF